MRRRALLSTLGVALAGCTARPPPAAGGDDAPATPAPTTDARDGLSVTPGPSGATDLQWSVAKLAPATKDSPCRLRIGVENAGPARTLTAAGAVPFPPTPGRPPGDDGGFLPVVVPVDGEYDPRIVGGCWGAPVDDPDVADDAPWDWGYGDARSRELAAGERIAATYHVLSSTTRFCFQRGAYRFARRYELDGTEREWAFTLQVPSYGRW